MKNYKLCVCDMDGTLLNSKGEISKENEAALKKLQQMGIEVVIATGRADLMVKTYIKQLNMKGHVISCNGGLIRNIGTGEILYSKLMEKEAVKEVIKYCMDNDADYMIYSENMVYSNKENPRIRFFEELNESLSEDLKLPITYLDKKDIKIIDDIAVLKVLLVCGSDEETEYLQKHFEKYDSLTVVSSAPKLLDIMAADITKGNALKILSEITGTGLSSIIAFGDNYNDLEMFQQAGMPIAMGNSVEKVKKLAKYVTKSNDESGIAYAINQYILNN